MKPTKIFTILAAAALVVLLCVSGVWAQKEKPFPTKQITYMVCFDPGGQSDREARRYQPYLDKIFKQKVIIDYKVGGGGALGWRELTRAKPDGYAVAGFNVPHIILQPMQQEVGYKTEQIVPVAIFQRTPLALAVLKTSPFKTYQEFVDNAKKNPGKTTIGGSGTFSGYHMAALRLEKALFVAFLVWYLRKGRRRLVCAAITGLLSGVVVPYLFIRFLELNFPIGILELAGGPG